MISSTTFGCSDTTYRSITLIGPEGDFDFDPAGICEGGTATFSLKDTLEVNSFSWDFGDGTDTSYRVSDTKDAEPTHSYNAPGVYKVILIARSSCGNDTAIKFITVMELSFAIIGIEYPNDGVCVDDLLLLKCLSKW